MKKKKSFRHSTRALWMAQNNLEANGYKSHQEWRLDDWRMLSSFVYDKFRTFLVSRAEKLGVEVKFVSPFLTSVIGMLKYMQPLGLNSATAAAMVIARKAIELGNYEIVSSKQVLIGF